ncbi:hypothetical protein FNO01nite_17120 [Flavobacterium noncentrifugens]|uniref:YceI-like domain-containing protein n=1 Tax=Flavobacterium noncentrifugens TaxID=1128970 RepID=A0A1G8WT42_9FLAO|nr:YceI family protein [Flavobacterium noncentrifugens]GEP51040.1 hypothetical protein FNO01nite_17120 [Flavobacterium noncentrifugens]SDJ81266.1 YceI-like domain-containing protein [Flavobacterium noncentrifugens]
MKKTVFLTFALILAHSGFSQKVITRSGEIKFEASMPALEEIAAANNTVSCVFDETTGEFATLALMKGFRFKVPLMEEHFNENYVESSTYPKSTFKGKVLNFDASKLAAGKNTFDVEGDLTMHGVTKKIKSKITFMVSGDNLNATGNFSIRPTDYNIEIPNLVKSKIAENVKIAFNFMLMGK